MAVKIAPDARRQFLNASGVPYSGAKLFYYAAGSTTKQNTYTTSAGNVANTNPIILDSAGRTPYGVWFTSGLTYKEVLAPSTDTDPPGSPIFTEDNLSGVNDTSISASQWIASALTPTYISSTQFSVVGDQTTELHVGRRLQLTVTAGTVYGRISVSAYTTLTTVTLVMDSGQNLDSGLSSFNWSILTATNPATPKLSATYLDGVGIVTTAGDQTVAGNKTLSGNTSVGGTLGVTGVATLSSTLNVTGASVLSSTLNVAGATVLSSTLGVTGAITPSQTNGIVGTNTNNDAVAGSVGEYLEVELDSSLSVALTTATPKTVLSLSLTAGDWEVDGLGGLSVPASTSINAYEFSLSTTTNTLSTRNTMMRMASVVPGAGNNIQDVILTKRIKVPFGATTTVYLVISASFTTSTLGGYGVITARRPR